MSTPNRELIHKANLAVADFAPGGVLPTTVAPTFFKIALKQNVLSAMTRSVMVDRETTDVAKLLWTTRVLYPGTSGSALPDAYQAKPSTSKVTLTTKYLKGIVPVEREVFEDQIEKQAFNATLNRFMAERVAYDVEDCLVNGDTTSTDPTLALQKGVLALTTSNVLNAGGISASTDVLDDLMNTLPEEFDAQNLMFFTNRKARSAIRRAFKNRGTALGDSVIEGGAAPTLGYDGIPLVKVPLFPNNLGVATNKTNIWYGDPKNIVMGFQRRVTVDTEFSATVQMFYIVVTMRFAIQLEHEPAAAKATEVLGQ